MEFDIPNYYQNIKSTQTTTTNSHKFMTQIVRLKKTTNQNQKFLKAVMKSLNMICD